MKYKKNNIVTSNPLPHVMNATHDFIITQGWEVYNEPAVEPTAYELAMQDWDCPEFAYRVEVPSDLGGAYPDIVAHAICNPKLIQIVPINGICRIYYNKLKPNHDGIVKALKLEPTPRPDKNDY